MVTKEGTDLLMSLWWLWRSRCRKVPRDVERSEERNALGMGRSMVSHGFEVLKAERG